MFMTCPLRRSSAGEHRGLTGVYYIPSLTANLISVGQLDENGCESLVRNGFMRIRDQDRRLLARIPRSRNQLYPIRISAARPICHTARSSDEAWRWHARYDHLSFQSLRKLVQGDMVRGLLMIDHVDQVCDSCLAGKQRRALFSACAKHFAEHLLDLVHGDLCGPISPVTRSGNRYFLLLVDDQAPVAIKRFQAAAELESDCKLWVLRTDRGGKFTSVEFGAYCADRGVQRQLTAPYSPQQNGVVERRNQTVVTMAPSMMKDKGLPARFWGETVSTAVFLLNRAPTRALSGKMPYEAWHGVKPAVHFLRTLGCVAHVKNTKPNLKKLDDRSSPMIFLGSEAGSKAYQVFYPVSNRVQVTRNAVFNEAASWD